MSPHKSQVPLEPYIPVSDYKPGAIARAEADSAARAFAIGEHQPSVYPAPRAPRRGDLPDVDFSQVVRVPRRSIWARILAVFGVSSSDASAPEEETVQAQPAANPVITADNVIRFRRAA